MEKSGLEVTLGERARLMTVETTPGDLPVVLYVEDDDLTRERVAARLRRQGWSVLPAQSGEQALELCSDLQKLDVALLDLELPGISGVETWHWLCERFPDLAGVVCSGALNESVRSELQKLSIRADCCLCKPCRFRDLLAAIRRATSVEPLQEQTHVADGSR